MLNALRHQRMVQVDDTAAAAVDTVVLNALRHQRMVQPRYRERRTDGCTCAQRLTASEDGAGRQRSFLIAFFQGAQRLTASEDGAAATAMLTE